MTDTAETRNVIIRQLSSSVGKPPFDYAVKHVESEFSVIEKVVFFKLIATDANARSGRSSSE